MIVKFNTEFNLGDHVYHKFEEGRRGVIIDIAYRVRANNVEYLVAFGPDLTSTCFEEELSEIPSYGVQ